MKPIIYIGNTYSSVKNIEPAMVLDLYDLLSFEVPGAKFIIQNKTNWDGYIRLFNKKNLTFLTGLTHKVCKRLQDYFGVTPQIIWNVTAPEKNLNLEWSDKYVLRDYQENLVKILLEKKRGILSAATSSGKTLMIAKLIQELNVAPFLFYTLTRDLMYQSRDRLQEAISNTKIGIIGDGNCDIQDINIVTVQTATSAFLKTKKEIDASLKKMSEFAEMDDLEYKEFKKENLDHVIKNQDKIIHLVKTAKGIYFDEAHHASADTCKKIMLQSPEAFYRYGGTGTPERSDNSYLTIEGLFGRPTAVVTASDLIKKGWILKPYISFIELGTKRQLINTFPQDREVHIINNDERNACIAKIALKSYNQGLSTLILVQLISHGEMLEKMIPNSVFIHGSSKDEIRDEYIRKIKTGEHKILISSQILDEGADLPSISTLVIAGGGKSPIKMKQRIGRVLRKGSEHAYVFDFLDVGKWTKKHSKARMKILETEPEFVVKKIKSKEILRDEQKELF
jgi:superfamily II DNA or RNA helicase